MCISLANAYNEHKFMKLQYSAVYWSNTKSMAANTCLSMPCWKTQTSNSQNPKCMLQKIPIHHFRDSLTSSSNNQVIFAFAKSNINIRDLIHPLLRM